MTQAGIEDSKIKEVEKFLKGVSLKKLTRCIKDPCLTCKQDCPMRKDFFRFGCAYYWDDNHYLHFGPAHVKKELRRRMRNIKQALIRSQTPD
jgi:hypothetical protein